MRRLIWIAAAMLVLYCGYWVVASRFALHAVRDALAEVQASGQGSVAGVSLAGFPSRFDITLDRPRLVAQDGAAEWSAPFFQVLALSYSPNRVIAVWPHEQTLRLPLQTVTLTTAYMQASAAFGASAALPLDHSALNAKDGTLASDLGWAFTFDELRLGTRQAGGPAVHDVGLAVLGLRFGGRALDIDADAVATFAGPIDRSLAGHPAVLAALDLVKLDMTSGKARVSAKGRLTVTDARTPEGRIDVTVDNWRAALDTLVAAGAIRPELAPTWASMAERLALLSGDPDRLELPLIFAGGRMSLGPLPLGPAPLL